MIFRFEAALKEAREVDKLISSTSDVDQLFKEKPFLGLPFTTKDCFAVTGLSWTTGLVRRKGKKADFDAPTVKMMRNAGAIPIGRQILIRIMLYGIISVFKLKTISVK